MARSTRSLAAAVAALALAAASAGHAGNPRSQVRLLGTVVSSDATRSLAMVEAGGASRAVRVGQDLDGATVVEIKSEAVVLRRRGELETLALASVSRPASARGGDVPASPARSDAELAATDPEHARRSPPRNAQRRTTRATPAPAPQVTDPTGAGAAARSNDEMLAQISQQARFAAVNGDNGKLRGVALMFGDSVLERLGLRNDDVVTSINGVAIDSSGAALREARGIDPKRPVALGIERRGVPQVLQVDLRNLQH